MNESYVVYAETQREVMQSQKKGEFKGEGEMGGFPLSAFVELFPSRNEKTTLVVTTVGAG